MGIFKWIASFFTSPAPTKVVEVKTAPAPKKVVKAEAPKKAVTKTVEPKVAKVTKATGIDKAVKFIAGEDCGCDERRKALNKLFPYNKPECLKEDEYSYLKEFYKIHKNRLTQEEQVKLVEISNRVLHTKRKLSSCSSCVKELIADCKRLFDNYEQ